MRTDISIVKYVIVTTMIVLGFLTFLSGITMLFILPPSSESEYLMFLNLDRKSWKLLHMHVAFFFSLTCIIHVLLNVKWYIENTKRMIYKGKV